MSYTNKEYQAIIDNVATYRKQAKIEHFRKNPATGEVELHEIEMSSRLEGKLDGIIQSLRTNQILNDDEEDPIVGSA